jgi:hypothetical protein
MELIWLILGLLALDLAVFLFGADTRPGFEHSGRSRTPRPWTLRTRTARPGTRGSEAGGPRARRFISG